MDLNMNLKQIFVLLVSLTAAQTYTLTDEEITILRGSGLGVEIHEANDTITISHHGVPDHGFEGGWGNNPNQATEQNHVFNVPRSATVATEKGCLRLGPVGISLSGAPFYNPYTAFGKNAVEGNCRETFDDCSGHPSGNGAYHYHKLPACLYTGDLRNKFLGVAFDGYPIYGPMDATGKNWTSSDLDRCHGHTHDGRYIYRITLDFPYILGCYHGTSNYRPRNMNRPPPRTRRHAELSDIMTSPLRHRRQFNNNPCAQEEVTTWKIETCFAFCETPSSDLDDCLPPSEDTSEVTDSSTRQSPEGTDRTTRQPVFVSTVSGVNGIHVYTMVDCVMFMHLCLFVFLFS